jgi:tetratricopeptide (TPR) repeat protein
MVAALAPAGAPLDAAAARAAAAALMAVDDDRGELLPALREARAGAKDARARALATAMAAAAVAANRPADGLAAADDVLALEPGSRRAFGVKAWALRRLGRAAELDAAAEKVLAQRPADPEVLGTLASTKLLLGDYDGAAAAFRRAMDGGRAGPGVYNDAAWLELFRAGATPTVLDWARRAADASGPGEHAALNTLAAVYASLGRAAEARDVFLRSLVDERPLEGADWFVFGRIAEAWGLDGAARTAYAKVEAEKAESEPDPSDAKVLARRRLEAMGAPVPAKDERARTKR